MIVAMREIGLAIQDATILERTHIHKAKARQVVLPRYSQALQDQNTNQERHREMGRR
jgi:hypothetical protein